MKFTTYILSITFCFFLFSCGDGDKKEEEKETMKIGTKAQSKKNDDDNSVTIGLTGNDLMQYNKKEIRVKAGQEVTLNFRHIGKQDLLVMGHNFVLLEPGTSITEFSVEAANAGKDADWIPNNGENVIVHTKMIGGGQSTSITFDAPAPGTYNYICSFPGHSTLMQGKFIVE